MTINGWVYLAQVGGALEIYGLIASVLTVGVWGLWLLAEGEITEMGPPPKSVLQIALSFAVIGVIGALMPNHETLIYSAGFGYGPEIVERFDQRVGEAIEALK